MKLPHLKKGFVPLLILLTIGGILIFLYLVILYFGPPDGLDRFGLFGQKKQTEETAEAKGPPNKGGYGSCYVTPNPANVGSQFTVNGSGFKTGELLNVFVTDSHGTQVLGPAVDASGNFVASSYPSWSGTSTVNIYNIDGRKKVFLTSCAFQVS